jgi:hypothetical protein
MPNPNDQDRGPGKPFGRGNSGKGKGKGPVGPAGKPIGGLRLKRLNDWSFALDHPKCVVEMELDYAEGIELRKEGDPEGAVDALRYALQGCGDNMWVHCALGWLALEDFNDPSLARGHFGYGFELALKAIPRGFDGLLPRDHPANLPLYDAINGLIVCYEKLNEPELAEELKVQARIWIDGRPRYDQ